MAKTPDIYSGPTDPNVSPEIRMLRMASGHLAAQAVCAFAALDIPRFLMEGPQNPDQLAKRAEVDATVLYRLLRFLSTIDVVTEDAQRRFALTDLGKTLSGRPTSVIRDNALLMGSEPYWAAIGGLLYAVRTGENAFRHAFGKDFFDFLAEHREHAELFNATMSSSSRIAVGSILSAYDFSRFREVVDVAGGQGELLMALLKKNPGVNGVLYDAPSVIASVNVDPALAGRLTKKPGNFFESVPSGGDAYILRRILHDWNDANALEIVRNVRRAIKRDGKLVVIELAAPQQGESGNNWAAQDILMMLLMDGRERTEAELQSLLADAEFRLTRVVRTHSPYWIVEADPV